MTTMNIQQAMELALARHRAGDFAQAEQLYRTVLSHQPNNAGALHMLGLLSFQAGNLKAALDWITRAIALNPNAADFHLNQGVVLDAAGQTRMAVHAYRKALALRPNIPEAHANLGNSLRKLGALDESAAACRRALELRPDYFEAHLNLGNVLQDQGKLDEAIASFEQALRLRPELAEAHHNLGIALAKSRRLEPAISAFRTAVARKPDFVPALVNLARLLRQNAKGDPRAVDEAIAILRQAATLASLTAETHLELATLLQVKLDWEGSIAAITQALAINPDLPEAYHGLGISLDHQGKTDRAILAFRRATALKPDEAWAHARLGVALRQTADFDGSIAALEKAVAISEINSEFRNNLGVSYQMTGRMDQAIASYERAVAMDPANHAADSNRVYALWFDPNHDSAAILRQHRLWAERHANLPTPTAPPHATHTHLRIGYVAADFRDHVIGRTALPLLHGHHHDQFEIFCYANSGESDALTERFKSCADGWRNIHGIDDTAAAGMIRADKIDILVDLTLHMSGGRLKLFALKPAPVQITFGYPGTTGLDAMDWRLSDPWLDPPGETDHDYAERSYRLPDSFWCYDPETMAWESNVPEPGPLPATHHGFVTFGCLNNFAKVNAGVLELWSRVLREVKGSRLLLLAPPGDTRRRVLAQFAPMGVDASRVDFVPHQTRSAYLAEFQRIDITLDTLPYNGHATSLDSLWMGVPVITRVGRTVVGRAGWSQLSNLKLTELAARSEDEFVQIARDLAADLPRLAELRTTLRQRMLQSPLTDAARFTANVETAYRDIWNKWSPRKAEG